MEVYGGSGGSDEEVRAKPFDSDGDDWMDEGGPLKVSHLQSDCVISRSPFRFSVVKSRVRQPQMKERRMVAVRPGSASDWAAAVRELREETLASLRESGVLRGEKGGKASDFRFKQKEWRLGTETEVSRVRRRLSLALGRLVSSREESPKAEELLRRFRPLFVWAMRQRKDPSTPIPVKPDVGLLHSAAWTLGSLGYLV